VYIFEEAHAIKNIRGGFTAFLAEIDKMPKGVYIIMCTTAVHDIPNDLRSRAIPFTFNRLNKKESTILAKKIASEKHVTVSGEIVSMIVKNSKGIPRDIEKLIDFASENYVSVEEMRDYLQEIGTGEFISLFNAMKFSSFSTVIELLEDCIDKVTTDVFVRSLRDFCVDAAFLIDGGVKCDFTASEAREIQNLISSVELQKIIQIIEGLRKDSTESDVKLAVIKLRSVLQGKTLSQVVTMNTSTAAKEKVEARKAVMEATSFEQSDYRGKLKPLSTKSLDQFN
jgi:DNA polymerase III gamma/tau subunit